MGELERDCSDGETRRGGGNEVVVQNMYAISHSEEVGGEGDTDGTERDGAGREASALGSSGGGGRGSLGPLVWAKEDNE